MFNAVKKRVTVSLEMPYNYSVAKMMKRNFSQRYQVMQKRPKATSNGFTCFNFSLRRKKKDTRRVE